MFPAEAHSLRLDPQRPIVEFTEPAIVVSDVSMQFESTAARLRQWTDPSLNALLRHTLPPTRVPFRHARWCLQGVSFTVYPGEIVALIGVSGAGKSTLLKLLARTLVPSCGSIQIRGRVSAVLHPQDAGTLASSDEVDTLLIDDAQPRQPLAVACGDLIARSRRRDATVILATDDLKSVCTVCTRAIWFSHGVVVQDDRPRATAAQFLDKHQEKRDFLQNPSRFRR